MTEREQPESPPSFELTIQVEPADIDQLGHVNNVNYLRWVQDVAAAHWNAVAPDADKKKLLWIVLRHEIDYKQPTFAGEVLIARTWVGEATRLRFERHTEFIRVADGRTVAKARSFWCPINAVTGRPVGVSPEARASFYNS